YPSSRRCRKTGQVNCATAIRVRGTYYRAKFFRLKARRGYRRALLATVHRLIGAIYIVLDLVIPTT
ncbi:MAG: hypothetical protein AAFU79_21000, partial [Myxococcota bacterium]